MEQRVAAHGIAAQLRESTDPERAPVLDVTFRDTVEAARRLAAAGIYLAEGGIDRGTLTIDLVALSPADDERLVTALIEQADRGLKAVIPGRCNEAQRSESEPGSQPSACAAPYRRSAESCAGFGIAFR
jgi:hypothetical protein